MQWKASQLCFALTMIAIGFMGLIAGSFAPIWAGVPKSLPDRQLLAYLSTFVSLACGAGLLMRRTAAGSALTLLACLIAWTLLFKGRFIVTAPLVEVSYQSFGENLVLISAAWLIFAAAAAWKDDSKASVPARNGRLRIPYMLYGMALVAFGFSHFAYLNLTAPLVPKWMAAPVFWAYFTGSLYLVTGFALIAGAASRVAAVLSAVQIALITFLVWGPGVIEGRVDSTNWQEPAVSWALTAAAWVIAASFDRTPWIDWAWRRTRGAQAAA